MKNLSDTIENRSSGLQACSAVPQPTVPPGAEPTESLIINILGKQVLLIIYCISTRQYTTHAKTICVSTTGLYLAMCFGR